MRRRAFLAAAGLGIAILALGFFLSQRSGPAAVTEPPQPHQPRGVELEPAVLDSGPENSRSRSLEDASPAESTRAAARAPAPSKCDGRVHGFLSLLPQASKRDSPPAQFSVTLRPTSLAPLEAAEFALSEDQTRELAAARNGKQVNVAPGSEYELKTLARGTWVLECRAPGYLEFVRPITIRDEEPDVRADIVMGQRNLLRVALRCADGSPFVKSLEKSNADLYKRLSPFLSTHEPSPAALAARNGALEILASRTHMILDPDSDAWCEIEADLRAPAWIGVALGDQRLAWKALDPGQESVVLVLEVQDLNVALGGLVVTLLDQLSGEPIPGATVDVEPSQGARLQGTTDARGKCSWKDLVAASVRVHASGKGYCPEDRGLVLRAGQASEVSLELVQPVSISGRLVDDQGLGVAGRVMARRQDGDPNAWGSTSTAQANADGTFEFRNVHPGQYLVQDQYLGDVAPANADEAADARHPWRARADARFAAVYGIVVRRAPKFEKD